IADLGRDRERDRRCHRRSHQGTADHPGEDHQGAQGKGSGPTRGVQEMKRNIFAIVLLSCLTSACSIYHVNSVETTDEYYPSKQTASDVVYLESVDKPHT